MVGGCTWERKAVFKHPRGGDSVEIQQRFPVNLWGIRILLHRKGSAKTLYEKRGDTFLTFVDVFWSVDSKELAVFTCGSPSLRMAYNLTDDHSLPFVQMQSDVAAHIRTEYHLDSNKMSDEDTLLWACTDGQDAFSRHHQ